MSKVESVFNRKIGKVECVAHFYCPLCQDDWHEKLEIEPDITTKVCESCLEDNTVEYLRECLNAFHNAFQAKLEDT